jgi:S1-C subfamily serine protease
MPIPPFSRVMNGTGRSRRGVLAALGSLAVAGCTSDVAPERGGPGRGDTDRTPLPAVTETTPTLAPNRGGQSVTGAYRDTIGSVVLIRRSSRTGRGQGSGFAYDANHVITNEHVVSGADSVSLQFKNGAYRDGEVVGTDPYTDLAVVEIPDLPDVAESLSLAESDPAIGTRVVALGNPFGLEASASAGVVSGLDRTIPRSNAEQDRGFEIPDAIQTDAAVNPGNSGGPLITLDGTVVAVISAGISASDNIGFGISAPLTRRVVPDLIADGEYDHSLMGVRLQPVTPAVAQANDLDTARGIMVVEVVEDGPSAGILQAATDERPVDGRTVPVGGDVIVGLGDRPIHSMNALSSYLALETSPGEALPITVLRDGSRASVSITLGERPEV